MSTNLFNPIDKRKYPSRWPLYRGKQLFRVIDERSDEGTEDLLSVSHITGITPRSQKNVTMFRSESLIGYKLCQMGDIVANTMWTWQGAIGVSKYEGVVSPAYNVYRQRKDYFNSTYLDMLLREHQLVDVYHSLSTGIRPSRLRLYPDVFLTIEFPVPPRAEQDQIVRFLDWKVSEINKLIGIRRKEIQELEEFKRSRIADIIMGQTAGKKKKSHINWMPFIPENWDEKPLIRYAFEQCKKNTGMVENNLLSLSYGKIVNKDINTTDGLLPANFEGYQIVDEGNIILRLTDLQNDHNSLRTGLVTQKGIITSAYLCLNTRDGILPEYLQLELHVADLCKAFYGMGGGVRQSIGFKDIKRMYIAIPSLKEQKIILSQIHNLDIPIDDQINTYHKIILELEALKNTIISDVVTGKIDVRNIPVPAYEHVDDLTADDGEGNDEETGIPGEED